MGALSCSKLGMLLLVLSSLLVLTVKATTQPLAYQNVRVELFLDTDDDNIGTPCDSPNNYTLSFKNMKLDDGRCVTHLFPQTSSDAGEKWMQFSAKALVRQDSGLQIWLYFTRDEITGAITYCGEENIQNLPYPLEVSPNQNGVCQVISLPKFQLDDSDDTEQRTMAMRVSYDVVKAAKLVGAMKEESHAVSISLSTSVIAFCVMGVLLLV